MRTHANHFWSTDLYQDRVTDASHFYFLIWAAGRKSVWRHSRWFSGRTISVCNPLTISPQPSYSIHVCSIKTTFPGLACSSRGVRICLFPMILTCFISYFFKEISFSFCFFAYATKPKLWIHWNAISLVAPKQPPVPPHSRTLGMQETSSWTDSLVMLPVARAK